MEKRGYKTKIQAGSNRAAPYPDAHFNLLLSVKILSYEGTEESFLAALHEFRRVLKLAVVFTFPRLELNMRSIGAPKFWMAIANECAISIFVTVSSFSFAILSDI